MLKLVTRRLYNNNASHIKFDEHVCSPKTWGSPFIIDLLTSILRIFQHTPGTYQNDPQPTVYVSEFLSFGALGMPGVCETGVCWGSLRSIVATTLLPQKTRSHRFLAFGGFPFAIGLGVPWGGLGFSKHQGTQMTHEALEQHSICVTLSYPFDGRKRS